MEQGGHPYKTPGDGIDANGRPVTDYQAKYEMSAE